ncbi:hypothetical protein ILUMI_13096 [Ignelater luminosus]|uniref:Uncharacterized protein n=1 Tax=Ignelater luminosus TaxID=2038154 RepID=A0A8K0CZ62_IGNLU|nr:hypothetical protein ILUMI_13096 [Ignelater luminosus]
MFKETLLEDAEKFCGNQKCGQPKKKTKWCNTEIVFNYERRTDKQKWSRESMQKSTETVLNDQMGYYRALLSFGVPVYYEDQVRKWLRRRRGRVFTLQQITKLFNAAYLKAATLPTPVNEFKKTGVWLVDNNVFTDADFLPSKVTSANPKIKETTPEPESELSFDNSKPGLSNEHEASFIFISPKAITPVAKISGFHAKGERLLF